MEINNKITFTDLEVKEMITKAFLKGEQYGAIYNGWFSQSEDERANRAAEDCNDIYKEYLVKKKKCQPVINNLNVKIVNKSLYELEEIVNVELDGYINENNDFIGTIYLRLKNGDLCGSTGIHTNQGLISDFGFIIEKK